MTKIPTYTEEIANKVLANATNATYTQVFTEAFATCDRIVYEIIGHASVDVTIDVTAATNSAGSGAVDILTAAVTFNSAGVAYVDIAPGALPQGKDYISPKVTRTAGTYTLIEKKYNVKNPGDFTQDATVISITKKYF
jgi:hypothetical protein